MNAYRGNRDPKETFDPEGSGYDYDTAQEIGGPDKETRHWFSRDPRTGKILKGRQHKTWGLAQDMDERMGHTIIKDAGRYFSIPTGHRTLYQGEADFFKANPNVAGMASEDQKVLLNPYRRMNDQEARSVMENENLRLMMRNESLPRPNYAITDAQNWKFRGYSPDIQDVRETIAARVMAGDPSAGEITPEQRAFIDKLRSIYTGNMER